MELKALNDVSIYIVPLLDDNIEVNTENILQENKPLGKSKGSSKKKVN